MDLFQHSQQDNCLEHNQPTIIYNTDPKIGACCIVCWQQQPGFMSVEQIKKQQNEIYQQANKEIDFNHQIYQQLLDKLVNYKQSIICGLDKIIQIIIDQIKIMKESKAQLNNIIMSNNNKQQRITKLQEAQNNQKENNKLFKDQVKQQLNELSQQFTNIDEYMQILSSVVDQENQVNVVTKISKKILITEVNVEQREKSDNIQFELIKESNIKEENDCYALAFNKDNTILAIAIKKEIVIYEFKNGKIINELQKQKIQAMNVYCLYFMKKSNSFVSGSWYDTIIIWVPDQHNKWVAQQTMKEHKDAVNCILMNRMENQLISGSSDKKIKFWGNSKGSWTSSQSIQTKQSVLNMSLNEMEDKLIVCQAEEHYLRSEKNYLIQVLMQQNKDEWELVQTFDYQQVYRLGFTVGDQFAFTTLGSDKLEVYDYDIEKKKFLKIKSIEIQAQSECYHQFPCQFIKSLRIMTCKNGRYLNIIKIDENNNYELMQEIKFESNSLYGRISDDGQYIATWDNRSKEIQIRKIKYGI